MFSRRNIHLCLFSKLRLATLIFFEMMYSVILCLKDVVFQYSFNNLGVLLYIFIPFKVKDKRKIFLKLLYCNKNAKKKNQKERKMPSVKDNVSATDGRKKLKWFTTKERFIK